MNARLNIPEAMKPNDDHRRFPMIDNPWLDDETVRTPRSSFLVLIEVLTSCSFVD